MRKSVILFLLAGAACTETPTDIPPCVLPSDGCPVPDAATMTDAASDAATVEEQAIVAIDGGLGD